MTFVVLALFGRTLVGIVLVGIVRVVIALVGIAPVGIGTCTHRPLLSVGKISGTVLVTRQSATPPSVSICSV